MAQTYFETHKEYIKRCTDLQQAPKKIKAKLYGLSPLKNAHRISCTYIHFRLFSSLRPNSISFIFLVSKRDFTFKFQIVLQREYTNNSIDDSCLLAFHRHLVLLFTIKKLIVIINFSSSLVLLEFSMILLKSSPESLNRPCLFKLIFFQLCLILVFSPRHISYKSKVI